MALDATALDGTWSLTMQTPIGERRATLLLAAAGSDLTGQEGNSTAIYDAGLAGDTASWKADITSPMSLTLEFTAAAVAGGRMSGTVSAAGAGSWPFAGTRA
ncbi:MAG: hypothetical protein AB7K67_07670 [Hyphomicrobiaceae bacterium]